MKKLFLALMVFTLNAYSAFMDPVGAQEASKRFLGANPSFPKENIGIIECALPDGTKSDISTGILLAPLWVLTCGHSRVVDTGLNVFFNNTIGSEGNDLHTYPSKHHSSRKVEKVFSFLKVKMGEEEMPITWDIHSSNSILSGFFKQLPHHDFALTNAKGERIHPHADIVLLRLESPIDGVRTISLSMLSDSCSAHIVGYNSKWNFWTGESSWSGEEPPLAKKANPLLEHPSFVREISPGNLSVKFHRQILNQTIFPVKGKPKAFSLFVQEQMGNDESFKLGSSLPYHPSLHKTEQINLGPVIGGYSGGPVFIKDPKTEEFKLIGLVSQTLSSEAWTGEKCEIISTNLFQTFFPSLIEKISKVMERPLTASSSPASSATATDKK